jgi:hypothetical protein
MRLHRAPYGAGYRDRFGDPVQRPGSNHRATVETIHDDDVSSPQAAGPLLAL